MANPQIPEAPFAPERQAAPDKKLYDALHALTLPTKEELTALLKAGGDPNAKVGARGATPLHIVAASKRTDLVDVLLTDHGRGIADVNARDMGGFTPAHEAASAGMSEMLKRLKEAGADMNTASKYNITPLHVAARQMHQEAAETLVSLGADPFHRLDGKTAREAVQAALDKKISRPGKSGDETIEKYQQMIAGLEKVEIKYLAAKEKENTSQKLAENAIPAIPQNIDAKAVLTGFKSSESAPATSGTITPSAPMNTPTPSPARGAAPDR